jgi:hypothetical protein
MKKLLAGCLVIAVLGVVVLGVGAYMAYRAASPYIEDARSYLQGMSQLAELDQRVANKSPHAPPASGELTDEQVQRFVRVQQHLRTELGQRVKDIEERYKHLRSDNGTRDVPLTDLVNSLRDITGLVVDAKRFQVDALNKEGFSQAEYSWVRERMFQAAGVEIGSRLDLQKLQDAVRSGTGFEAIQVDSVRLPEAPLKNRELVKPFVQQMHEWLPLIFFGL